ncbi:type II secretion system protein GspD [Rhodospirillum sp. A1_3_36]|uniref:type II secretion system protein GspD n=1 Tax=Rhodospirillum sp. A1_3_36 TaxID=3391666 RepID=UPI0039A58FBC
MTGRILARAVLEGLLLGGLTLGGCAPFDEAGRLEKDDYRALVSRRAIPDPRLAEPPIPLPLAPVPPPVTLPESIRRVTVIADRPTPVADLLIGLCRSAEVDLELEPGVTGSVVFSARERPFDQVVRRLAAVAGLRVSVADGVVHVGPDLPRPAVYRLDALNMARGAEGSVSTSTDVFTSVGDGAPGQGGRTNASSSSVTSKSTADLWTEVAAGLSQILGTEEDGRAKTFTRVPSASTVLSEEGAGSAGADRLADTASSPLPATDLPGAEPPVEVRGASFHVNRQAGLITVVGTQSQQEQVSAYLDQVREATATQVLIEAKIVEVNLNDQFRGGIDWTALSDGGDFLLNVPGASGVVTAPLTDTVATFAMGGTATFGAVELGALVNFIKTFGTVRTLSSPRLTVMNNQTAVLKVAENEVYFVVDVDTTTSDGVTQTTYSSEINTVPIGLVMTVQPSVEPGGGRVTLGLRPTISRVADRVSDPAVALQSDAVDSLIPVVEVRELDSVVTIDNGAVVVMGGLMQERVANDEEGLPGLLDIPALGRAFRTDIKTTEVIELVVLLRATVIGGAHSHAEDRALYRTYAPDPRAFPLAPPSAGQGR